MELIESNKLIDYKKLDKKLDKISNPYIVKCIVLGDRGIGKSTLVNVFSTGHFNPRLRATIGIDFVTKVILLSEYNQKIKLQIWDTAGQEKFKSIVRSYLRDTYVAFLVFDITDRQSWVNLIKWKEDLEKINNIYDGIPHIVLVGTKSDLNNHVISTDEIKKRAEEWNCRCYVISSKRKNAQHVICQMFSIVIEDFHKDVISKCINDEELPHGIYIEEKIDLSENKKKINCCSN